jgi:glyoxylase-like metal-dependent hydrolase (beta-lactamase superfamily II)
MSRLFALLSACAALAGPFSMTAPAGAADGEQSAARPEMVDRFYRGRSIINAAANAAGGAPALRGVTSISFTVVGEVSNDIQGYAAARIGDPAHDGEQIIYNRLDFAGARFNQIAQQRYKSGYDSAFGTIWLGGAQHAVRYMPRDYSTTESAPSPFAAGGAAAITARFAPPLLLQRALQNFRSITWIGEGSAAGEVADIVEFSFDEITRFRLFIARKDAAVRRVEGIAPDPIAADIVSAVDFSGTQSVGGFVFPTNAIVTRRGPALQKIRLENIAVNPTFTDDDFAPPADFASRPALSGQLKTTNIAGRVYEVSGLAGGAYQTPFVVMDDFVVAFEAPLGVPQSRQVISEIRKAAGDKPIRYVVISHFHADHAGGVGAYVEAGATILSSAENESVLAAYARSNRPQFQGQEGPADGLVPRFETVPEEGFDIRDAKGGILHIVDFPRSTHVEHMLALHDPGAGVFMGADHHIEAVRWNPTFERTASWIRSHKDVATLLGVHDRPMTREALLEAAKARRGEGFRSVVPGID